MESFKSFSAVSVSCLLCCIHIKQPIIVIEAYDFLNKFFLCSCLPVFQFSSPVFFNRFRSEPISDCCLRSRENTCVKEGYIIDGSHYQFLVTTSFKKLPPFKSSIEKFEKTKYMVLCNHSHIRLILGENFQFLKEKSKFMGI